MVSGPGDGQAERENCGDWEHTERSKENDFNGLIPPACQRCSISTIRTSFL